MTEKLKATSQKQRYSSRADLDLDNEETGEFILEVRRATRLETLLRIFQREKVSILIGSTLAFCAAAIVAIALNQQTDNMLSRKPQISLSKLIENPRHDTWRSQSNCIWREDTHTLKHLREQKEIYGKIMLTQIAETDTTDSFWEREMEISKFIFEKGYFIRQSGRGPFQGTQLVDPSQSLVSSKYDSFSIENGELMGERYNMTEPIQWEREE